MNTISGEEVDALFGSKTIDWSALALGGLMGLGYGLVRQNSRVLRDERWAANESAQRDFHLRMGLERAQDKARFLRQHYGLR